MIQPRFNAVDHVPYTLDPAKKALPDLFDACRYLNVAVCSFSPLAGGFLTGKYKRDAEGNTIKPTGSRADTFEGYGEFPDRWWQVLDEVEAVAEEINATPAQVAISWVSRVPDITSIPIIGATSVGQLDETLKYVDVSLSDEQHQRISDAGKLT